MVRRSLALGAVLAALLTAPAAAQLPTPDPAIYVPNYAEMIAQNTFLGQALGQPGNGTRAPRKPSRGNRPKPKPKPTAAQRRTLRFGADAAVSTKVNQFFLTNFAAPGVAAETVIADLNRLREIGAADLRSLGWSARHLGDVAAYGLLVSYFVANQTTRAPAKGVRGLRRAVTDALARDKAVRRRSDGEQQRLAELLLLRVGYYTGWSNDLAAKGDAAGAETVRRDLVRFARSVYGLDVSAVRLTSTGFSARK
jgi:hypothetical protein